MANEENFTVACNVCGNWYENWFGSTPCCGSIAYEVDTETGKKKDNIFLYVKLEDEINKE